MSAPIVTGGAGFNAQHSPMGAFTSFTCGHFGTAQGLAVAQGAPAGQMVLVGCQEGTRSEGTPRYLPFFADALTDRSAEFAIEEQGAAPPGAGLKCYRPFEIGREYGLGSDTWETPDFRFSIYTPFGEIPDPAWGSAAALRRALVPAVTAELVVNNRDGETPKTAYFGLAFTDDPRGTTLIDSGLGTDVVGFANNGNIGFAGQYLNSSGEPIEGIVPLLTLGPSGFTLPRPVLHLLGECAVLAVEVPPGACRTLRLAIGSYVGGTVTTRLAGSYYYSRCFGGLADVLQYALDHFDERRATAQALDGDLAASGLSTDQQFLVAHATRSYFGSTELLDIGGQPHWVVNEGQYMMINTLDLSVDQVFFELRHNPWVVRNLLDGFARWYSYVDEVVHPRTKEHGRGGISFCHDQGLRNNFSPFGHSSYEQSGLDGCFSHMTQEQVCNWSLMAGCYLATADDADWAAHNRRLLYACLESMLQRDDPDADNRNGVMSFDSSRCDHGAEITTYDSLDHSLAQARNNLYIAVKCWATYLALATWADLLDEQEAAALAVEGAERAAATVAAAIGPDGWIPAVFEDDNPGYASRILPAVEGLVYPLYWADQGDPQAADWVAPDGPFGEMLGVLQTHVRTLLAAGRGPHGEGGTNIFPDGGIRLSSTSSNSWISKIAIFQHVARRLWGIEVDGADAAHVTWETTGQGARMAMCDQIYDGEARGSLYYPRCVTTWLWWPAE